ncbi:hypothetical protein [Nocardioides sp. Root140]|uniref:hypothetical protein n=1 Tax=Nocardioides sp. Root140 TaxID=1736460 RepID=UPI0006F2EDB5|nr:hypothetical protein [Nocardioides sp. Root140]KQY61434.1 hypothetical protein ASD30_25585 [Nocardioides sp. Root140]
MTTSALPDSRPQRDSPAARGIDQFAAWCIALMPLVQLWTYFMSYIFDGSVARSGVQALAGLAGFLGVVALGLHDIKNLEKAGYRAPYAGWLVFYPAYLIARARRVPGTVMLPVTWFLCMLLFVFVSVTFDIASGN